MDSLFLIFIILFAAIVFLGIVFSRLQERVSELEKENIKIIDMLGYSSKDDKYSFRYYRGKVVGTLPSVDKRLSEIENEISISQHAGIIFDNDSSIYCQVPINSLVKYLYDHLKLKLVRIDVPIDEYRLDYWDENKDQKEENKDGCELCGGKGYVSDHDLQMPCIVCSKEEDLEIECEGETWGDLIDLVSKAKNSYITTNPGCDDIPYPGVRSFILSLENMIGESE